jgi:membrane associated rhomboid family serine protease
MFALFMFGTAVEQALGSRRYLTYFLVSVVGAGLMHVIITVAARLEPVPIIGASGGVMAVLVAFGMFFPNQRLIIFPIPVPIKAWIAVILYGLFDLVMGVSQANSGIAHFAHIGGLVTGFVMIRYWMAQARRPRD